MTEPKRDYRIPAILLVLGWVVFLAHRVWTSANVDIVSRPQVLTAPILLEGKLLIDPPRIEVGQIRYVDPAIARDNPKAIELLKPGAVLTVFMNIDPAWDRQLDYCVPLVPLGKDRFEIWGVPRDFGEPGPLGNERIYPATAAVLEQWNALIEHRRAAGK